MENATPDNTAHPPRPELAREQIAERARRLWMERGSPGGRDLEHWLDAERQLRDEFAQRERTPRSAPPAKPRHMDLNEAEKRLDGLVEPKPNPARRTPAGENL
ncbi:DUF2934 domain-containing protein [Opitutus sp. ER46]|uniref:DUF2934 domain-containing protein n=1 Tax=Opitutus sp. ER46 TaxID=2161864 RepID=UPI000D319613|nr:DUF2934 domain-containing protein [Opitutus sp. ER46]PTX97811.1 hypothetical protein DB354_05915 [Opitutus sp. ER46]